LYGNALPVCHQSGTRHSRDALFGMSRMFEAFVEGSFARIAVFRKRENAKGWLACCRAPSA